MTDAPRRTHPATILIRALKDLPQTLIGIPALYAALSKAGTGLVLFVPLVMLTIIGLIAWAKWRAFTYQLGDGELVIADGLLNKSRRSIPLERIQDVSIERRPLARLLGLALVRIETGGGDKNEGVLDSVSLDEAARLRALLRRGPSVADRSIADGDAEPADLPDSAPVFAMSLRRVLTLGLFRFSLVWIAAIFAGLQFLDNFVDFGDVNYKDVIRQGEQQVRQAASIGLIIGFVVLALLVGMLSGVIRTLLRQYDFRLTAADGRFRRVRGLTTRTEVVIANRRVQLAVIRKGAITGRLGWQSLSFQMLGGSDDPSGLQDMAPLARPAEIAAILAVAELPQWDDAGLQSVAPAHGVRAAISLTSLPLISMAGLIAVQPRWWPVLFLLAVPLVIGWVQRRFHRYSLDDGVVRITRGAIVRRHCILPVAGMQTAAVVRGPIQRMLGLASVRFDTAGAGRTGGAAIHDLTSADAHALVTRISAALAAA
ncbi:PH domain-containing protein [Sphingomonas sp. BGYR3]|uniref:PH domain-containing protein n=1 Tax=Sphingomonas sp. BGYR3 TaxID=2975483 RepID=UPI0021A75DDB|nr:PH domain-containing protein [Sphingomonas sp. BGYR3]